MDFISYIRSQNEKLTSWEYVFHLWHELEENCGENEVTPQCANDFNNHLPVHVEDFWKLALEKLSNSTEIEDIDENLKIYLLVLIYHCMTQSQEYISKACVVYVSETYLLLLMTPQSSGFYKNKLYRCILNTIQISLESGGSAHLIESLIRSLCLFLNSRKVTDHDLEVTLASLMQIIFIKSKEVIKNFDELSENASISFQVMYCLKNLFIKETVPSRKFIILTYFFNGLRRHNAATPHSFNIIQVNFRNLIKNLHPRFKEDHYKTFLNAFIHTWKHPDFCFYGEAVLIMNNLKEKHYRHLIDILNKIMMTKDPPKNLFKLSLAIICCPPKYISKEKVDVTNQILLRNILLNCISMKSEVSSTAIESLAEILMSPDSEKDYVQDSLKFILNGNIVSTPTMLQGLKSLIIRKWSSRSKNKNIVIITISIIRFSDNDYRDIYREILEILCEEATPFDLKPFLPLMLDTYVKLTARNFKDSALLLLKIIFKMALHPMASSSEFVKCLYMAIISPNPYKGATFKTEIFIEPIISREFNFEEFFQKCHTLGLIRDEHICRLMKNIPSLSESDLKLLCAIVHLSNYEDLSSIATHINTNFMNVCNNSNLKYLFYIYNNILKNKSSRLNLNHILKYNEIMTYFIKDQLFKQNFRWDCVANAFALLRNLRHNVTDSSEDLWRLKEEYDRKMAVALEERNTLPLLYYSQLVFFGKIFPNDENLEIITNYLKLCTDNVFRRSPAFHANTWIACLLLYTNICTIKTNLIDTCLNFLQSSLECSFTYIKLASINMIFDLCNMVTHSFDDLINYMFNQLVYGDNILKKTCLLKIDRLIRDDYLKLELEQFLILMSILGDRNLNISDYLKQLLSENFLLSNSSVVGKYFVPLVVHINGYKKHPTYQVNEDVQNSINYISKNMLNRRKIYHVLLGSLPMKFRFNIISTLSVGILEKMLKGTIKHDDGFWDMIKDSIYIFKLMTFNSNVESSGESFYKKVSGQISKYIIDKSVYDEKRLYPEFNKDIVRGTETLLKLLFFTDNDNVQKHIKIPTLDAILHWTYCFLPELVHIVHVERCTDIQNYYVKVDAFLKKNNNIRYTEELCVYDNDLRMTTTTSSGSLFTISEGFIPQLDHSSQ